MKKILEQFIKHGLDASFHYADDTGAEWYIGDRERDAALELYFQHPELQAEMRKEAKGFLWSLKSELTWRGQWDEAYEKEKEA